MGAFDDIIARNKAALRADQRFGLVADKLSGSSRTEEPIERPPPFTLPSQRKSRSMSPWRVIAFMLVIGTLIGLYTCRMMAREAVRERQLEQRP